MPGYVYTHLLKIITAPRPRQSPKEILTLFFKKKLWTIYVRASKVHALTIPRAIQGRLLSLIPYLPLRTYTTELRSEELDRGHGRVVAPAEAVAQDARVAAVALAVTLGRLLEEG